MLLRLLVASALLVATPAAAATINLDTGSAAWTVTQVSGADNGLGSSTNAATVLTGVLPFAANLPGFEAFAWSDPFGGAVWIGQLETDGQFSNGGSITCGSPCGATGGNYRYDLTFDGSLGGSLVLDGFTADNHLLSLSVTQANNGLLYSCTLMGPGLQCAASQTSVTPSSGPLSLASVSGGIVTISALVRNLDGPGRNPSGFILSGSADLNSRAAVPEPAQWALLVTGFALSGAALRTARRRTTSRAA